MLFADGKSLLTSAQKELGEQRHLLQSNIALFGGYQGLIENQDKYPVYVSEQLHTLTRDLVIKFN